MILRQGTGASGVTVRRVPLSRFTLSRIRRLTRRVDLQRSIRANMSKKILGISWLNGRFHAAALNGSAVSASWACPQPVPYEADFGEALAEAVRETRFTGTQVVVVLDHGSLLFHVEETPPV